MHSAALISPDGSIDWLCFPRFDAPSVFAAILDDAQGGRFRLAPSGPYESRQEYLADTNVLRTTFLPAVPRWTPGKGNGPAPTRRVPWIFSPGSVGSARSTAVIPLLPVSRRLLPSVRTQPVALATPWERDAPHQDGASLLN